jgi:thymidylate kinase
MANIIILEGLSRTGKSTISKRLETEQGFRSISIKNKMPEFVENLHEFYHGMHVLANEVYRTFPEETFVLDRSFLSELVYSKFFKRKTLATVDDSIANLLFDNNFILVYLSNSYERYIERIPKDRITYSEQDFVKQKDLFDWYFDKYKKQDDAECWQTRFVEIDTTTTSIDESINIITESIKNCNFCSVKKETINEN